MRYLGNYIYDHAHSFFGEDFDPMCCTGIYCFAGAGEQRSDRRRGVQVRHAQKGI